MIKMMGMPMTKLSAIAVLLGASIALASPTAGDVPLVCNQTGAWSDEKVQNLTTAIENAFNSNDRFSVLSQALKDNNTQGFTGPQTAEILSAFTFSDEMVTAAELMQPYVLGLTCQDVVGILNVFSFSGDKLKVLAQLVNLTTDHENNQTIINAFTFAGDQAAAMQLIADSTPYTCVFGNVKAKYAIFIVDTSGSMAATFVANNGQKFCRLTFAQYELDTVLREQLQPYQSFNVLSFSDSVAAWQDSEVPVTDDNVNSALQFIDALEAGGGTDTYDALAAAFQDPDVVAIYLLSDGQPDEGPVTDPNAIIEAVVNWNQQRATPVPVHTTALDAGYFDDDDIPAAQAFMSGLAAATGGIYRAIQ